MASSSFAQVRSLVQNPDMNANKKHNILLWSPNGCGEHYNGPAKYTYRVYSMLDRARFRFTLAHGSTAQEDLSELFDEQHLVRKIKGGKWSKYQFVRSGLSWIRNNADQFDLLHAVAGYEVTVPAAHLARKMQVPVVLFVSNEQGGLASKGGIRALAGIYRKRQRMAREFDAIIAMSSEIETELLSYGIEEQRIVSIPNFADTGKYTTVDDARKKELRRELGLADLPTIVFVGRLCERKRPHLIVEAISLLASQGKEVQAVFVGPYSENEPYFKEMISKAEGVMDRLVFAGFTNKVEQWLQASDIFCLPSRNEGMPGALVEAMACGLPAVVSPFSSANDLVRNPELGKILTADSNPEEIADAVSELLQEKSALQASHIRRDFIVENFSLAAVSKMYRSLFERVIAGKPARI